MREPVCDEGSVVFFYFRAVGGGVNLDLPGLVDTNYPVKVVRDQQVSC